MNGFKTYALMAILFVAGGAMSLGYIDQKTYEAIAAFIVPAGIAALRHGITTTK